MAHTAVTKSAKMKKLDISTETRAAAKAVSATPETPSFLAALEKEASLKLTENGATALSTTGNPLLDFFATAGALRTRKDESIVRTFLDAFLFDPVYAMKALFYARDIRGGLGERRTFKVIINALAYLHPDEMARNIHLIPEYGRYDDLYAFVGTPLEKAAFSVIIDRWNADVAAFNAGKYHEVSLLGKWLKSENASSKETRRLAHRTMQYLGLSPREYRESLTAFRSAINIVESAMSANEWKDIDYSKLPSLAHKKYRAAFARHDAEGYQEYLAALSTGKTKINAATLYPYDLVHAYTQSGRWSSYHTGGVDETVEAQWKALPNYLTKDESFLVMVDTSGSMYSGNAIDSSVGLGIYFAERSKGKFKNHFITFTDQPRLVKLPSGANATLKDKVAKVLQDEYVGYDTNLEAAFELVLQAAVKNHLPQKELPTAIVVISDMEINQFGGRGDNTTFTEEMKERFAEAGYKMPVLVYWNVQARANTFHANAKENVRFVSGQSASTFKSLCESASADAVQLMMEVLDGERYKAVI